MYDRVEIEVRSGDGGDGAVSFRREKFVPYGGPDGGDGGKGSSVVIRAEESVSSLSGFTHRRLYRAGEGGNGGGKRKRGRGGDDLILPVPVGTVVSSQSATGRKAYIADLDTAGAEIVVVRGGKGGWGNTHFASSTNQAPRIAQMGEAGQQLSILLEMRLIADAGIIGYPNAGKSTLLAAASSARPRIDSYPFTTLEPVPGVVEVGQERFIMAEIPGLIAGAHLGKGLGHDFLRHVLRTRMLIHLISGTSAAPIEDMWRVNEELALFDATLEQKPQVVALNKIDLPEVRAHLPEIRDTLVGAGIKAFYISAATGEGVPELLKETLRVLKRAAAETKKGPEVPMQVLRPQPREARISVRKEGDVYVLGAPELERLKVGAEMSDSELGWQLKNQLARLGVNRALKQAGARPGDKIRCGSLEWEW